MRNEEYGKYIFAAVEACSYFAIALNTPKSFPWNSVLSYSSNICIIEEIKNKSN